MKLSEIFIESIGIRDKLKQNTDFKENRINNTLANLLIIGQDPTIKNEKRRDKITHTLNLDKNGALKNYISDISKGLNIELYNIYATNVFKYFYTIPPVQTMHVLQVHLEPNHELLKEELAAFPIAKIITLGEPVLQLLSDEDNHVREYWDYNSKTKHSNGNYKYCYAKNNKLGRNFYPFPHQPSIRKEFYKKHLAKYISFVKNHEYND